MPSCLFGGPTTFSSDRELELASLLQSSRSLVNVITAGLGANQGMWTSFLMRGLYDPRLFAIIIRFIAVFHCCK